MKYKSGDILINLKNFGYVYKIIDVLKAHYTFTILQCPGTIDLRKQPKITRFSHVEVENFTRKITKLDKALL